jgi:hypothetical protein
MTTYIDKTYSTTFTSGFKPISQLLNLISEDADLGTLVIDDTKGIRYKQSDDNVRITFTTVPNQAQLDAYDLLVDNGAFVPVASAKVQINTTGTLGTTANINVNQTGNTAWNIPDVTDESLGAIASQVIQNKKLNASNNEIVDADDDTKIAKFQTSGANTGTYTKLICNQTGNREIEFPDTSDILAGLNASQFFQNKSLVDANTLIVDDITPTKSLNFELAGATTGSNITLASVATGDRTVTFPDATTSLIGNDTNDLLSGKTFVNLVNNGYTELVDMIEPSNSIDGKGRLYKKTGSDGLWWLPDSGGSPIDVSAPPSISFESFDGYTTSSSTVSGSYVSVPWNEVPIIDAGSFSHTANSASITINKTSRYEITYNLVLIASSGSNRSQSISNLFINDVVEPGTESRGYHRNNTQGGNPLPKTRILNLTSGDILVVKVARFSGNGSLQLLSGGCSIVIKNLIT